MVSLCMKSYIVALQINVACSASVFPFFLFLWPSAPLTVIRPLGRHLGFPNVGSWNETKGAGFPPLHSFFFLPDSHSLGQIFYSPQASLRHIQEGGKAFRKKNSECFDPPPNYVCTLSCKADYYATNVLF